MHDHMREAFAELERVAALAERLPVLVTGETGTGKELVARGLHDASAPTLTVPARLPRRRGPEDGFREAGAGKAKELAEVDQWLAEHDRNPAGKRESQ